jgi:hypothetical protein
MTRKIFRAMLWGKAGVPLLGVLRKLFYARVPPREIKIIFADLSEVSPSRIPCVFGLVCL